MSTGLQPSCRSARPPAIRAGRAMTVALSLSRRQPLSAPLRGAGSAGAAGTARHGACAARRRWAAGAAARRRLDRHLRRRRRRSGRHLRHQRRGPSAVRHRSRAVRRVPGHEQADAEEHDRQPLGASWTGSWTRRANRTRWPKRRRRSPSPPAHPRRAASGSARSSRSRPARRCTLRNNSIVNLSLRGRRPAGAGGSGRRSARWPGNPRPPARRRRPARHRRRAARTAPAALSGFTLPPYRIGSEPAILASRAAISPRMKACTACACSGRGGPAGADRPDRLVGDDRAVEGRRARRARGPAPAAPRCATRSGRPRARQGLAHAQDRHQAGVAARRRTCGATSSLLSPWYWRRSEWPTSP